MGALNEDKIEDKYILHHTGCLLWMILCCRVVSLYYHFTLEINVLTFGEEFLLLDG